MLFLSNVFNSEDNFSNKSYTFISLMQKKEERETTRGTNIILKTTLFIPINITIEIKQTCSASPTLFIMQVITKPFYM